ncbi:two pore domain potassium channel family protein [Rhodobacteraceae bacterium S2214]|nr:two pore domain potassium channel family protein [Rhodobacteraceae bacterium S2214]
MFLQIFIGSLLLLVSIGVASLGYWIMETLLGRAREWLGRPPHRLKMFMVLAAVSTWILGQITIGVWLWALTFLGLGIFETLEPSVYFALVAFTTLGFGDILLPTEWRILGGMAAANGLLNFGLLTAVLIEGMRFARVQQRNEREKKL